MQAVRYWTQAGDAALSQSAYAEAARYLAAAIELIRDQTEDLDLRGQELELQLKLAQAHRGVRGFGADDTKKAFERAYELIEADPTKAPYRFAVEYGLWSMHTNRAEMRDSLKRATQALAHARAQGDHEVLLCAHRLVASSYTLLGDFAMAGVHFEHALGLVHPAGRTVPTMQFGLDQAAACLAWLALARQIQGFAEQSEKAVEEARSIGASMTQVDARAFMHGVFATRAMHARDASAVAVEVEVLTELVVKHRLSMHRGLATCLRGWMAQQTSRPDEAVAAYERGIAEFSAVGTRRYVPSFTGGLAYALACGGRHHEALQTIERAILECEKSAEGWCDAELWRLRGEVVLRDPEGAVQEAVRSFDRALALARGRGAKLWELRAAASLARLWASQGHRARAFDLLTPVYASFTEGFDTADLREARALLGQPAPGRPRTTSGNTA